MNKVIFKTGIEPDVLRDEVQTLLERWNTEDVRMAAPSDKIEPEPQEGGRRRSTVTRLVPGFLKKRTARPRGHDSAQVHPC